MSDVWVGNITLGTVYGVLKSCQETRDVLYKYKLKGGWETHTHRVTLDYHISFPQLVAMIEQQIDLIETTTST